MNQEVTKQKEGGALALGTDVRAGVAMRPPRESFTLVPKDLTEAMKLAELIANSDLAPKDFKGKPGNVLIAVQMGAEVGLSPMAAIQSIAVINGKPSLYGDVGKAILLSNGFTIEEFDTKKIKSVGFASCTINRPGHPACTRTFSIDDAKAAGLLGKAGPWSMYQERQMAWRAFWFCARDIAADVLKGLAGAEELADITEREINPAPTDYQTGTQRLKSIVETQVVLKDVLDAIGKAETPAQMFDAIELAVKLSSEEDKEAANTAYKARMAELKKAAEQTSPVTGEVETGAGKPDDAKPADAKPEAGKGEDMPAKISYAKIAAKLNKASDLDNLNVAADLIQLCDGGADQIEELNKIYKARATELKERN